MDRAVIDSTGLDGVFEIHFNARVPPKSLRRGNPDGAANDDPPQGDFKLPGGEVIPGNVKTIQSALQMLGLRLVPSEEAVKTLFVDAFHRGPTENLNWKNSIFKWEVGQNWKVSQGRC
jgi:uncharacterized protein (TIGR03435 family)